LQRKLCLTNMSDEL